MKPVEPIVVTDLFEPVLEHLLQLLRSLSEQEWRLLTPCPGWTVKDIGLHLLADDIGKLSMGRDQDTTYVLPPGPDFVSQINAHNAIWLEGTRRMSTRVLCDLLDFTGHQVSAYFKSLDPLAVGGRVSWAGPEPAPIWFDIAREYTERWHHQQHIRQALQRPGLLEARFLAPVLDTFVRALPWTFRAVAAPEGTIVELHIVGDAGKRWFLVREGARWSLFTEVSALPDATVILDQEIAWQLFTKGIAKEQARQQASVQGDSELAGSMFDTVSIIA